MGTLRSFAFGPTARAASSSSATTSPTYHPEPPELGALFRTCSSSRRRLYRINQSTHLSKGDLQRASPRSTAKTAQIQHLATKRRAEPVRFPPGDSRRFSLPGSCQTHESSGLRPMPYPSPGNLENVGHDGFGRRPAARTATADCEGFAVGEGERQRVPLVGEREERRIGRDALERHGRHDPTVLTGGTRDLAQALADHCDGVGADGYGLVEPVEGKR